MKRIPIANRVLVELDKANKEDSVSEGGIVLETAEQLTDSELTKRMASETEGVVAAIGPHAFTDFYDGQPWYEVGDRVHIIRFSGDNFIDEETGTMYRIINSDDVLAIIQEG